MTTSKKRKYIPWLINRITPDFLTEENGKNNDEIESLLKRTQIIANFIIMLQFLSIIVAIVALIVTSYQSKTERELTNKIERNKNAVEAVSKIYNETFLNNYYTFLETDSGDRKYEAYRIMLNTYYSIAIIYNSGIADTTIIRKAISEGIKKFISENDQYYSLGLGPQTLPAKNEIELMIETFK